MLVAQRSDRSLALETRPPGCIKRLLCGNALTAYVVKLGIEIDHLIRLRIGVLVISRVGRSHGRKCQRLFHKLVGEFRESRITRHGAVFFAVCAPAIEPTRSNVSKQTNACLIQRPDLPCLNAAELMNKRLDEKRAPPVCMLS